MAQNEAAGLTYSVRGIVVDAESGTPLEAVHVSIPGRSQATVTNADGSFNLKSGSEIGEIVCSYLGYKSVRRKVRGYVTVRLHRENIPLSEAYIVSANPEEIVKAALEHLWDTYCTEPELLRCFYRETLQKRSRYTYVAEAVARMYKSEYDGTIYNDAASIEKSRLLVSQRRADTVSVKTLGGPTQAIVMDILKNNQVIFNKSDLPLYGYEMQMPEYIGGRLQFVIRMTPNTEADYALYNCKLFIDRELLTFTRIEASLDMSDRAKATRMILVSKPISLRFFPQEASVVLNYSLLDGGKTRLEYFRSTIRFACDWKRRLFKTHYTTVNELVITDVEPEAKAIPRAARFRQRDYLNDKVLEFRDPDFWQNYNIIEPSESLEHAIDRLKKGR